MPCSTRREVSVELTSWVYPRTDQGTIWQVRIMQGIKLWRAWHFTSTATHRRPQGSSVNGAVEGPAGVAVEDLQLGLRISWQVTLPSNEMIYYDILWCILYWCMLSDERKAPLWDFIHFRALLHWSSSSERHQLECSSSPCLNKAVVCHNAMLCMALLVTELRTGFKLVLLAMPKRVDEANHPQQGSHLTLGFPNHPSQGGNPSFVTPSLLFQLKLIIFTHIS